APGFLSSRLWGPTRKTSSSDIFDLAARVARRGRPDGGLTPDTKKAPCGACKGLKRLHCRNFLLAGLRVEALPLVHAAFSPPSQPLLARAGIRLVGTQAFGFHVKTGLVASKECAVGCVTFLTSHRLWLL